MPLTGVPGSAQERLQEHATVRDKGKSVGEGIPPRRQSAAPPGAGEWGPECSGSRVHICFLTSVNSRSKEWDEWQRLALTCRVQLEVVVFLVPCPAWASGRGRSAGASAPRGRLLPGASAPWVPVPRRWGRPPRLRVREPVAPDSKSLASPCSADASLLSPFLVHFLYELLFLLNSFIQGVFLLIL